METTQALDHSEIHRIKYPGVIDADAHILEPPDVWTDYCEAKYADRALRIEANDDGLEMLMIDNRPSTQIGPGYLATLGLMGETDHDLHKPDPSRTYLGNKPFGAMDPTERMELIDAEGMDAAIIYPTLSLLWEAELKDIALSQAYCRAYNRWIVDFCADSDNRLVPIAHISLGDPDAAAAELERSVKAGCKGAFMAPFTITQRAHGDAAHDPVFAFAEEAQIPIGIHPTVEPGSLRSRRFDNSPAQPGTMAFFTNAGDGVRHCFTSMFAYSAFSRFPKLKFVVLESGAGWIGYWLDRMDSLFFETFHGDVYTETRTPSEIFCEQCYISCDPFEKRVPAIINEVGAERFFWASDYPHADHPASYMRDIEAIADVLPASSRQAMLGANVREVYSL